MDALIIDRNPLPEEEDEDGRGRLDDHGGRAWRRRQHPLLIDVLGSKLHTAGQGSCAAEGDLPREQILDNLGDSQAGEVAAEVDRRAGSERGSPRCRRRRSSAESGVPVSGRVGAQPYCDGPTTDASETLDEVGEQRQGEGETLDRQPWLEGDLVRIRPLQPGDFEALRAIASDPLLWEQHPSKDRTETDVFQRWFDEAMASGGAVVVIDRADGRIIGTSRFDDYNEDRGEVEIGWTFLARSHWGGSYNGDTKRLMLEHAFRSVDAVVFRVHSLNLRSQRAVKRLGAVRVGCETDPQRRGENHVFRLSVSAAGGRGG